MNSVLYKDIYNTERLSFRFGVVNISIHLYTVITKVSLFVM